MGSVCPPGTPNTAFTPSASARARWPGLRSSLAIIPLPSPAASVTSAYAAVSSAVKARCPPYGQHFRVLCCTGEARRSERVFLYVDSGDGGACASRSCRRKRFSTSQGLTAVVTGGAAGIGLAYAEVMAANGAHVTLSMPTARRWTGRSQTCGMRRASPRGVVADVTDHAALRRCDRRTAAAHRPARRRVRQRRHHRGAGIPHHRRRARSEPAPSRASRRAVGAR